MSADDRVRAYYDALRAGEALAPFFAPGDDVVKVGISERLVGGEEVAEGLREQTETTTGWHVESRDLRVTERDRHAWFADSVAMAWTDTDRQIRFEFDTRWSGTLELRAGDEPAESDAAETTDGDSEPERWQFVGMHVSTARDLG
ncbi:nuclear transport factor 2 family protein [Halosimplex sp. J119]